VLTIAFAHPARTKTDLAFLAALHETFFKG
jgi:hypothetical protein